MQIVIDIPQGLKIDFENENWTALTCMEMKDALMKGTVLPKGHGDLIDRDKIDFDSSDFYDCDDVRIVEEIIDDAPTIIDADKENRQ